MGLFSFLSSLFNKNIECPADFDNNLVQITNKRGQTIYLNKKIIVKRDELAILNCKDKLTDTFVEGIHDLDERSLPLTFRKLKIYKILEKGKKVKHIKSDVYYVNLKKINNFVFYSNTPFYSSTREFGKIRGYVEGTCDVQVLDGYLFLKFLLKENAIIKDGLENKVLGLEIGNDVNAFIEKSNYSLLEIVHDKKIINQFLESQLESLISYYGIRISNLELKAITFKGKLKDKLNEYIYTQTGFLKNVDKTEIESIIEKQLKNSNADVFVDRLGTSVNSACKYCGASIGNNDMYCFKCGKKQI